MDNSTNTIQAIERERNAILYKMYVSNVANRLREIDEPSSTNDTDCKRWTWELMQNAKDSISGSNRESVDIKITAKNDQEVIFEHNGCPFNGKTYLALLYKYSEGKAESAESTGRFGTGFLTTHCLSKQVRIEGPIKDDKDDNECKFEVTMYREGTTNQELIEGIERMENEKRFYKDIKTEWTKYFYLLKTPRNKQASIEGIRNFVKNIGFTMLFNPKFKNVSLVTEKESLIIKEGEKNKDIYDEVNIKEFYLYDEKSEKIKKKIKFIHIKIKKFSEQLSSRFCSERYLNLEACIKVNNKNNEIIYDAEIPCLFCSFPLVGSESHELPITLNSNDFEPSTERNQILLNGKDTKPYSTAPSDTGINKYILTESQELFRKIVDYASSNNYKNLYKFTRGLKEVPKFEKIEKKE